MMVLRGRVFARNSGFFVFLLYVLYVYCWGFGGDVYFYGGCGITGGVVGFGRGIGIGVIGV